VLKKAGIIAGAVAAGLVALTPLAFADSSNTESGNVSNNCDLGQAGPQVAQSLTQGDSGAAGLVNPVTGLVAPITAQTQAANCLNIVNSQETNTNSGNDTTTDSRTRVDHSFNNTTPDDDGPFGPDFPFGG
jgi:hypothetical protein